MLTSNPDGPAQPAVPDGKELHRDTSILTHGRRVAVPEVSPLAVRLTLELNPPSLQDSRADVDRLRAAIEERSFRPLEVPLDLMREAPVACRRGEWRVTVVVVRTVGGWRLARVDPGHTRGPWCGLALDIGTTTVVASLVDLQHGEILGTAADYNGQLPLGEDVLSRICVARTPEGLAALRGAVSETINRLASELCSRAKINPGEVFAAAVSANTTMAHLWLGLDPSRICRDPYAPVVNCPGVLRMQEVELALSPAGAVYMVPGVGSYVGGDIVAGVLVAGLLDRDEPSLFVDVGTNAEMVLGNREWLVACAGAAGPALEGGVAGHGMRAAPGAIWQVRIDPVTRAVSYRTIGDLPPVGICGSGLIDCIAEFLVAGIVDRAGQFADGRDEFVLVPAEKSGTGKPIAITQRDIDSFLRTKGAVNAALETLLAGLGCSLEDLGYLFVAGAFGEHVDLESAVTVGLYPDLPRHRIVRLGNSALEGARQVLLSETSRRKAEEIASRITYLQLNASPEFMSRFAGSRFLPHTNLDLFPTVKARLAGRTPPPPGPP